MSFGPSLTRKSDKGPDLPGWSQALQREPPKALTPPPLQSAPAALPLHHTSKFARLQGLGVLCQDAGCTAGLSPALPKSQGLAPSTYTANMQVEEARETVLYEGVSVGGSESQGTGGTWGFSTEDRQWANEGWSLVLCLRHRTGVRNFAPWKLPGAPSMPTRTSWAKGHSLPGPEPPVAEPSWSAPWQSLPHS